jgi:hypothetical protein
MSAIIRSTHGVLGHASAIGLESFGILPGRRVDGHQVLPTAVFGRPVFAGRETKPAVVAAIGPRLAMAEVLAEYLRCAVFRVAGQGGPDRSFSLERVQPQWPDASQALPYPCASVIERTDTFHEQQFQPRPDETTIGAYDCMVGFDQDPVFPKTVLWRTAEATAEFQLDFWTSALADRQAIEAQLSYLFSPGQERTGVLLGGHPRYYAQPVRVTLLSSRQVDEEDQVYPNERRLQVNVRANVDVVDLRLAVLLTPRLTVEARE